MLDEVSFGLASELIPVPRDDEEILHVLSYYFPIVPPERGNGVQQEGQCIQTNVPELLELVSIILFEGRNLGQLSNGRVSDMS